MEADLTRKIKAWEDKLLDLSKRNRMLHFRETKRTTLLLLEPNFEELFQRVAINEESLTFQRPIDRDSDIRVFSVLSLLDNLSCPIPVLKGDIKTQGSLVERQKTLRNMRAKARLAMDEQGTNILYMAVGFIEWREKNDSSWIKSPLVLVPVSLVIESAKAPISLEKYDDDIVVNPTLAYYFSTQYGIDLPAFEVEEDASITEYMDRIEDLVSSKGWKVRKEISLGLLSFLKINMYKDLRNNSERMKDNPILLQLSGECSNVENLDVHTFNHDSVAPQNCFQVVDADSSQQDAILLSSRGVSFVMQGPPGTGKSQTITNIIAQALGEGKKVLFVSEKMAALQVVYRRLTDVHLSEFCLPLHSNKANKKDILRMLGETLRLKDKRVRKDVLASLDELNIERKRLNQYAFDLHKVIEPLQMSIYEAYGRLNKLQEKPDISFTIPGIDKITREQLRSIVHVIGDYHSVLQKNGGVISDNPWIGTTIPFLNYTLSEKLKHYLDTVLPVLTNFNQHSLALDESGFFSDGIKVEQLKQIYEVISLAKSVWGLPQRWFENEDTIYLLNIVGDYQQQCNAYNESKSILEKRYNGEYFLINASSVLQQIDTAQISLKRYTNADLLDPLSLNQTLIQCNELTEMLRNQISLSDTLSKELGLDESHSFNGMPLFSI